MEANFQYTVYAFTEKSRRVNTTNNTRRQERHVLYKSGAQRQVYLEERLPDSRFNSKSLRLLLFCFASATKTKIDGRIYT